MPTLLIVEDSEDVGQYLVAELSPIFKIQRAETGEDALDIAEDHPPDLVLLDVMLASMDGYEVCRKLRAAKRTATVPVLMFSARGDVQTRIDAFDAGADDFLHKPFEIRELKARLASLARRAGVAAPSTDTPARGVVLPS
jgi:DNA-binding response OmpR family regulator